MELLNYINPYNWIICLRNIAFDKGWLPSKRFDLPVICVGNLTVGGTGKTPHIEYIINLLKDDYAIATLSRGYRRTSKGYVKACVGCDMRTVGDEPSQLKNKFPEITVAVDEKRVHGIENLLKEDERPEIILLDDAFQHRYVKAGLYILLVDYNRPVWRDSVMPFGRLREPTQGLRRADAVVITKCPPTIGKSEREHIKQIVNDIAAKPVFFSTVCYDTLRPLYPAACKEHTMGQGDEILLVTGIARPEPLKKELETRGANVKLIQFADHHDFTSAEIAEIASTFATLPSKKSIIVTTEKDAERIVGRNDIPQIIKENIYSIPIRVKIIDEENKFNQIIKDYVTENTGDRSILAVGNED